MHSLSYLNFKIKKAYIEMDFKITELQNYFISNKLYAKSS